MLVPLDHLPEDCSATDRRTCLNTETASLPYREGEIIICKGDTDSEGWYVAEISKVLDLTIQVLYFHTPSPPLEDYANQSKDKIEARLIQASVRL